MSHQFKRKYSHTFLFKIILLHGTCTVFLNKYSDKFVFFLYIIACKIKCHKECFIQLDKKCPLYNGCIEKEPEVNNDSTIAKVNKIIEFLMCFMAL